MSLSQKIPPQHKVADLYGGLKRSSGTTNETASLADQANGSLASNLSDDFRAMEADEALRINMVGSGEPRPLKAVLKEFDQQLTELDSRLNLFFNPGLSSAEIR